MQIMRPRASEAPHDGGPTDHRLVVESDEHEELVFLAASEEELEAKLDDFLHWAS